MFKTTITVYHDTAELSEAQVVNDLTEVAARHQSFYRTMTASVDGPYAMTRPAPRTVGAVIAAHGALDADDAGRE